MILNLTIILYRYSAIMLDNTQILPHLKTPKAG